MKIVKTSISLPEVLAEFANRRCSEEGFNSFSAYVAHLVRLDKEREEARGAPYPANPERILLQDKPRKPKP
ncbi:MAG: hypothetical protein KGL39_27950 [Patescibacteria group bacterium]|nr:hypothetical protein [Patescibacteria group bacterium]